MEKLLACAMDIGEEMLTSGAEVHRVEESVKRMCNSFGVERTDVFIITSSMIVTIYTQDGKSYTQTKRILSSSTDFEKLHLLNNLSRKICSEKLDEKQIRQQLENIANRKTYPFWLECLSYSVIAGAFTLFFGGNLTEMAVSLFIGTVVRFGILFSDKTINNKVFSKFLSSVIATILAFVAVKIGIIQNVDKVIIGNIMSLIPGIV